MASKRFEVALIISLIRLIFYALAREKNMEGVELKITRIRANLKQWELASKLGINQNRLSQYELGRKPIPEGIAGRAKRILAITNK
jgi:DNA-binding transcriptional regulator YiaG